MGPTKSTSREFDKHTQSLVVRSSRVSHVYNKCGLVDLGTNTRINEKEKCDLYNQDSTGSKA